MRTIQSDFCLLRHVAAPEVQRNISVIEDAELIDEEGLTKRCRQMSLMKGPQDNLSVIYQSKVSDKERDVPSDIINTYFEKLF